MLVIKDDASLDGRAGSQLAATCEKSWSFTATAEDGAALLRGQLAATSYTLASNMSVRASSQNARLLVVEDDPDISMLLAHSLGRAGFAVETLSSGAEVLAEARRRTPDLILLDLMLPGLDGLEVCRALRADPATAAMPVILSLIHI